MAGAVCNFSSYEPSSLVTAFHGIPHSDINLNSSPDTFELSSEYFEGIIIWACVPILAVVCLFILMSVYFICVCCCCCYQQHDERSKRSKGCSALIVSLLLLFGLACCGVALWAEFTLDENINSASDSASSANDLVQKAQSTAQMVNFTEFNRAVLNLGVAVNNSNPSNLGRDQAVSAVNSLDIETRSLESSFIQIKNDVNVQDFSSTLDTVDSVELARHWSVVAYVIVTIIVLFVMMLSICCGAICGNPICMVIALIFFCCLTITMWVAVGANLAYLVIAGDICHDPDTLIRDQFINSSTADLPVSTINYYLVCNETCHSYPFNTSLSTANAALNSIDMLQDTVNQYITNNSLSDIQSTFEVVVMNSNAAVYAVNNFSKLTDCMDLNRDYLDMLDGLCDDGYLYALVLFAMGCGLAIIFIMVILSGSIYAGLLSKGKAFDDETIVYDFPEDNGPSPWESYGTQQHYHNYNESFSLNTSSEPPKYTDLTTQESSVDTRANGTRNSGAYDNLNS